MQGASVIAASTLISQVMAFAVAPFLTRLYSPSDFGVLAILTSVVTVVGVLASLRYEMAIPLADEEEKASNLLALTLALVVATTITSIVGVALGGQWLAQLLKIPALVDYLWALPIAILTIGLSQVFNSWAIRQRAYGSLASSRIFQTFGGSGTQLAAGLLHLGALGLVLGQLVNQTISAILLALTVRGRDRQRVRAVSRINMRAVAREYHRFPKYSTGAVVLNAVSMQAPIFLLSYFFGPIVTGYYALGYRLLQVPINLIGQSVAQVYMSRARQALREGWIGQESLQLLQVLIQLGVPLMLVVGISAPEAFGILFGSKWITAGEYVQWLSPWIFLVLIASPLSSISVIREKQSIDLAMQAVLLLARVGSIGLGGYLGSPKLAILLFSISSAVVWLGFLAWIIHQTNNRIRPLLRFLGLEVIIAVILSIPLLIAKGFSLYFAHDLAVEVVACAGLSALLMNFRLFQKLSRHKESIA